jgi:LysM repeat protein
MEKISEGYVGRNTSNQFSYDRESITEQLQHIQNALEYLKEREDEEEEEYQEDISTRTGCRIDRTKEKGPITMKTAVAIVVGLHLVALGGIWFSGSKSHAAEIKRSDQDFLKTQPLYVGVDETKTPETKKEEPPKSVKAPISPNALTKPEAPKQEAKKESSPTNWPISKQKIHILVKGETLYSLSKKYNISITMIQKTNHIKDATKLSVGQKLVIPQ